MGTGEDSNAAKIVKTSSVQETPATPSYPDWSMQAYYGGAGAPAFYTGAVTSPTTHPYLWGGQHAMIPPYGTPVPYSALYPHGGIYPHPGTPQIPTMQQTMAEVESRAAAEGKDRTAIKKAKGILGTTLVGSSSKAGETVNPAASGSGNDNATESAESGSENSSDTKDNTQEENGTNITKKGSFHQMLVEGASAQSTYNHVNAIATVPPNFSMGMDLWSASAAASSGGTLKVRPNRTIIPPAVAPSQGGVMLSDHWAQDERELKRQKRKQSNRESARRSRLRKQAECEELQTKVESITIENQFMKDELKRLSEECERLATENESIKEELIAVCGHEAVSKLGISNGTSLKAQPHGDKESN